MQGRRKGGMVRTILRARRWEGAPKGETWFLPRGTLEPCISATATLCVCVCVCVCACRSLLWVLFGVVCLSQALRISSTMAISATKLALGQEQIALQAVCSSLRTNNLCWGYTQSVCCLLESRVSSVALSLRMLVGFLWGGAFTCVPRGTGPAFAEAERWLRLWESQMDQVEGTKTGVPLSWLRSRVIAHGSGGRVGDGLALSPPFFPRSSALTLTLQFFPLRWERAAEATRALKLYSEFIDESFISDRVTCLVVWLHFILRNWMLYFI